MDGSVAGVLALLGLAVLAACVRPCAAAEPVRVDVDFATRADPPLVKKFGVMNSGIVPMQHYRRDLVAMALLAPAHLRIDLSIGKDVGWREQIVAGTAEQLAYHWTEIDELSGRLNAIGVLPYWSFCYMPKPLQGKEGWRSPPTRLVRWGEAAEAFARHFREAGIRIGYFEVWNEPDFAEFFRGNPEEFQEMYRAAAVGMRRGDPDATVGGPAFAFSFWKYEAFLKFVEDNRLPMDFFSFHSIGGGEKEPPKERFAADCLGAARAAMAKRPYFQTTELHLSEYHPYYAKLMPLTGKHPLAARALDNFLLMLGWTDVTAVSWAQFSDPGPSDEYGLLHFSGRPKPAYGALAVYADMPIERVRATAPEPVRCMASADESKACVAVWNNGAEDRDVRVTLGHVPFAGAKKHVYRIDGQHDAFARQGDRLVLEPVESSDAGASPSWGGVVPAQSVVYLKLERAGAAPRPAAVPPGRIVKVHHYFPDRGRTWYACFDEGSSSALLGMGSEREAVALVGLTLDRLKPVLHVRFARSGEFQPSDAAALGLRVDYQAGDACAASVFFHDGTLGPMAASALPWGTGRKPDRAVKVDDLAGAQLKWAAYAPPKWTGRAIATAVLRDTGPGTRVRAYLSGKD